MDSVSRRTRSRWDEYYRNRFSELKRKEKDQERGGNGGRRGSKRVRNAVDGGEKHDDFVITDEERCGAKNIEHVESLGSRSSRNVAGKRVKVEKDKSVASARKRKLDMRGKLDADIVLLSYGDVEYLGEKVTSNGSSLKTGLELRSGSVSKVCNLDEVVSFTTKKFGSRKEGIHSGGTSGHCGRGMPRMKMKPVDGKQIDHDVSVDLENCTDSGESAESSDGLDDSVDPDLSEFEPMSEERDDDLDGEDYKADESLNSESSDGSYRRIDGELGKDDEYDDGESENVEKGEEENLSNTRMNARKESDIEQERDDESGGGCDVDDRGSSHRNRSSKQQETEDVVIIINDKEEFSGVTRKISGTRISKKKETDEVELEGDDIDERCCETNNGSGRTSANRKKDEDCVVILGKSTRMNARKESDSEQEKDNENDEGCDVDDRGSSHCNKSSNQQETENVVIIVNDNEEFSSVARKITSARTNEKETDAVELEGDDDIDEGCNKTSHADDRGSSHCNRISNQQEAEAVVIIVNDKEELCSDTRKISSARINKKKETDEVELERDDDIDEGCNKNVDDCGRSHCNRSSNRQETEDVIIIINDKEELSGVTRKISSARVNKKKETDEVELERDGDIDEGCNQTNDVDDRGSCHCNRSSNRQESEDVVIIINDKEELSSVTRKISGARINKKKETDEVELERDDDIDEGCNKTNGVDDGGSSHCNRSSNRQESEDVVIIINDKKETDEVELERDVDIDEGCRGTNDGSGHERTSANNSKRYEDNMVIVIEDEGTELISWQKRNGKLDGSTRNFEACSDYVLIDDEARKDIDTFGCNQNEEVKDRLNEIAIDLKKKDGFGLDQVVLDSDGSDDEERNNQLSKCFQSSIISRTQEKEPELGQYGSPVPIESASSTDNELID